MPGPIPLGKEVKYNQTLFGLASRWCNNARISYIQTGLKSSDLDLLKLVSEIQGTEKWPVRDLFQEKLIWKE